ncbi:MAG TPA: LysR substrate-binding domain-containing protein [Burkholderiaceae bacterium]|nr:LysR substrate-binding domain-containing protein [Burkholderiaceae bacterium]
MNARQLEVFRTIMRNGSLTSAAEALHVSQPAISKVLRHFELQIGYRLFERLGGRLVPTPEAHVLFRDADRIFREIEVLKTLSDRIRNKQLGLLRIGASGPPSFALIPQALARFRGRNPGVRVELQTMPAEEIKEHIVVGDLDIGVTMAKLTEPHLRSETIGTAAMVAVMRADSPLAALAAVTPKDLAGATLISYASRTPAGHALDQAFAQFGVKHEPQIEVWLSIAAAPLVLRGLGIALLDGLVNWTQFEGLAARPLKPKVAQDITVTTSAMRPQTRFGREFVRDLRASINELARRPEA